MSSAPSGSSASAALGDEPPEPRRERDAARLDADERDAAEVVVPLDELVRDARERPRDRLGVEQDLEAVAAWSGGRGRASSLRSFPASLDRVKGSRQCSEPLDDRAVDRRVARCRRAAPPGRRSCSARPRLRSSSRRPPPGSLLSRGVDAPWIASDESSTGSSAELALGDGLSLLGEPVPYYSFLYPLLVGVPLALGETRRASTAAQALQALVMSLGGRPGVLLGTAARGPSWALVAAGLAVLIPGLGYGGLLMTETLYYPAATVACWALAACSTRPTLVRQGSSSRRWPSRSRCGSRPSASCRRRPGDRAPRSRRAVGSRRSARLVAAPGRARRRSRRSARRARGRRWRRSAPRRLRDARRRRASTRSRTSLQSVAWQIGATTLLTLGSRWSRSACWHGERSAARRPDAGVRSLVATATSPTWR